MYSVRVNLTSVLSLLVVLTEYNINLQEESYSAADCLGSLLTSSGFDWCWRAAWRASGRGVPAAVFLARGIPAAGPLQWRHATLRVDLSFLTLYRPATANFFLCRG